MISSRSLSKYVLLAGLVAGVVDDGAAAGQPGGHAFAGDAAVDGQVSGVHTLRAPLARGYLDQGAKTVLDGPQPRETFFGAHPRRGADL